MGWRGAGGNGASDTGTLYLRSTRARHDAEFVSRPATYFFFGGVLMILGAIGEWIVGNTFPFVVFGTFGKQAFISNPTNSTLKESSTANHDPFLALQVPSGSPSAAPSSHLSTHTEPTSPIPHKWQPRMETLETR